MDTAKRYFTGLGADGINLCKVLSKTHKLCKPTQPVQLTHEAQMIEPIRSIPASCAQRIVELNHTLWTQLDNNEWTYVAPKSDVLTVLCSKHGPIDVKLLGTGKLQLNSMCKAYGNRIFILLYSTLVSTTQVKMSFHPCPWIMTAVAV